jgi:hypothetical protein
MKYGNRTLAWLGRPIADFAADDPQSKLVFTIVNHDEAMQKWLRSNFRSLLDLKRTRMER